ncbi:hypothetical protein Pyrfu_1814 [Pyrolobus fumarii 1A]|uniref:Uncharacterized protein n=1 Tax=Pyrolobus fumarii (strain DSM 11204 / 1A) TaxID=694429 RepID=G0ECU8_PYRF1|nr:hypothetical protein [Pyrolobus fumarii]AEM39668.1 hypothetical protein Pyrfu_1814 [Pyrolobus fumarii 1A]
MYTLIVAVILVLLVYALVLKALLSARARRLAGREWIVWLVAMTLFVIAALAATRGVGGQAQP